MVRDDYILQGINRVHDRLDSIDNKVDDLKDIVVDSKNRIDIIEANYAHRIDWKNLVSIVVSFCAILAVMISVAALYKPSGTVQASPLHSPTQTAPKK